MTIEVGTKVRLKRGVGRAKIEGIRNYLTATVIVMLSDIEGGVRLDRAIGGFRYWNVLDLDIVDGKSK